MVTFRRALFGLQTHGSLVLFGFFWRKAFKVNFPYAAQLHAISKYLRSLACANVMLNSECGITQDLITLVQSMSIDKMNTTLF